MKDREYERITVTIGKEVLKEVDQAIKQKRFRNRSTAIEHFVSQSMSRGL